MRGRGGGGGGDVCAAAAAQTVTPYHYTIHRGVRVRVHTSQLASLLPGVRRASSSCWRERAVGSRQPPPVEPHHPDGHGHRHTSTRMATDTFLRRDVGTHSGGPGPRAGVQPNRYINHMVTEQ
jgi:hypothetical protein